MTEQSRIEADGSRAASEARRLFELQHSASRQQGAPDLDLRRDRLKRLRQLVVDHADAFADAISADFGTRSPTETKLLEILPSLSAIRHASRKLGRWMKPRRRHVDSTFFPGRAWVSYEPLGVIGIISPWNYPLQLAVSPLVDAIAAGNRAMVKPSELTPHFSELLKSAVSAAFDESEVAVVTGGVDVGQFFSSLPFDHLLFTGSTQVGRIVYQAAAANLTPVTLELGGKSPAILCDDYPLEKAARSIAFGKWVNAGQTCIAPDYALVPEDKVDRFAQALLDQVRASYPAIADNSDYSSVISPRHLKRLEEAVEAARAAGARLFVHEDDGAREKGKIGPTLVIGAPEQNLLMREEIFGPVLPIIPYKSLDDAIRHVADGDRPLALYAFSRKRAAIRRILRRTLSGGVTLNGTLLHVAQEALPFGGVGASGIGAYHGEEGFRRFSHARGVFDPGPLNVMERLGPPWGKAASLIARFLAR